MAGLLELRRTSARTLVLECGSWWSAITACRKAPQCGVDPSHNFTCCAGADQYWLVD
jgi:hypothetical protein